MGFRIDAAISNREIVQIGPRAGHAVGLRGIAMGYNAQYDTVKIGFVDNQGNYIGEFTKVGLAHVEFLDGEDDETDHTGCESNEERSPFSTSRKTCSGKVTSRRVPFGLGTSWNCEKHWNGT